MKIERKEKCQSANQNLWLLKLSWRHFWDFYSLLPQRNSKQHAISTNVSFAPHLFLKKQYRSNVTDFPFLFAVGLQCFLSLLVFVQEAFLILNMFVYHVSLPSQSDNYNSICWNLCLTLRSRLRRLEANWGHAIREKGSKNERGEQNKLICSYYNTKLSCKHHSNDKILLLHCMLLLR